MYKMPESLSNIKYAFGVIHDYDRLFFPVAIMYILAAAILPVWMVAVPREILGAVESGQTGGVLLQTFAWVFGITVIVHSLSSALGQRYEMKISLIRTSCFRIKLINKLIAIRYPVLEDSQTQQLIGRAWNVSWSNNFGIEGLLRNMASLIGNLLTLVGMAGILASLSPIVPVIIIMFSSLQIVIIRKVKQFELSVRKENNELDRQADYLNDVSQDFKMAKEMRIMGLSRLVMHWFGQVRDARISNNGKTKRVLQRSDRLSMMLSIALNLCVYAMLTYAVLARGETIANFVLYFGSIDGLISVMSQILGLYENVRRDALCITDMRQLMALPDENAGDSDATAMDLDNLDIEFEHVSYRYPNAEKDALTDVSCKIEHGQYVAIIGDNGAGKSTFVKLLCGLLRPTQGRITIGGHDAATLPLSVQYSLFGVVFQDIHQYAFTLGENVAFTEDYDHDDVERALRQTQLDLDSFPKGVDTMLQKSFDPSGVDLSGGQAQNLAIARAVYRKDTFKIMDEPTAALDPMAEQEVYRKLHSLTSYNGALYISHRLSSTRFCDWVLVFHDGCLIEQGTHDLLIQNESSFYAKMYTAQSSYYQPEQQMRKEMA